MRTLFLLGVLVVSLSSCAPLARLVADPEKVGDVVTAVEGRDWTTVITTVTGILLAAMGGGGALAFGNLHGFKKGLHTPTPPPKT